MTGHPHVLLTSVPEDKGIAQDVLVAMYAENGIVIMIFTTATQTFAESLSPSTKVHLGRTATTVSTLAKIHWLSSVR